MSDLITLQEAVRDQVRQTVLAAIPKESIDKIVKDYFENDFKVFVKKELELVLKEKFNAAILQEGEMQWRGSGRQQISRVSREVAESIMDGFANTIINNVINNMRNGMLR